MTKFYIINAAGQFMKIQQRQIIWTENKEAANDYDSKYAAKKHARNIGLEEYGVVS